VFLYITLVSVRLEGTYLGGAARDRSPGLDGTSVIVLNLLHCKAEALETGLGVGFKLNCAICL
jgi:hypothetical protein